MKYFNVAGPCDGSKHYMIESITRLSGVEQLIDMEQYFVIHAARQSGKTTYIQDLTKRLNTEGNYYALYCSLESAQNFTDPEKGIPAIISCIKSYIKFSSLPHKNKFAEDADLTDYVSVLRTSLTLYCMELDKPLVIFFDEADCLSDNTLILFLRQLRSGYNDRNITPFIHSVA
ncbi:MAG: hypothetical protein LBB88_02095, partial [Planctomycetaceae bacterium]|nr:hypothetical protein [Planctomycetaceae bacterium]